jgi:hypothetical protein
LGGKLVLLKKTTVEQCGKFGTDSSLKYKSCSVFYNLVIFGKADFKLQTFEQPKQAVIDFKRGVFLIVDAV